MSEQRSSNERVERLRLIARIIRSPPVLGHWPHMRAADDANDLEKAADEIERLTASLAEANASANHLTAERGRLRAALKKMARSVGYNDSLESLLHDLETRASDETTGEQK